MNINYINRLSIRKKNSKEQCRYKHKKILFIGIHCKSKKVTNIISFYNDINIKEFTNNINKYSKDYIYNKLVFDEINKYKKILIKIMKLMKLI